MPGSFIQTKLYVPSRQGAVVPRARLVERLNLGLDSRMMLRFRTCGLRLDHTLASWLASTPPHPPHVHLVICQPCGSAVAAGSPTRRGELDVLRLLATDLDGPEIASQLMVSLNTLRTQTKSIYTRLGVNSRRAAVHRAGELHLLSAISTR